MVMAQLSLIQTGGLECKVNDMLMFSAFPFLKKTQVEEMVGRHFLLSSKSEGKSSPVLLFGKALRLQWDQVCPGRR